MNNKKRIFRLKFESESSSIICFVDSTVSHIVLNEVGKRRVIRFTDTWGNRHAVVMDSVFHVEADTALQI